MRGVRKLSDTVSHCDLLAAVSLLVFRNEFLWLRCYLKVPHRKMEDTPDGGIAFCVYNGLIAIFQYWITEYFLMIELWVSSVRFWNRRCGVGLKDGRKMSGIDNLSHFSVCLGSVLVVMVHIYLHTFLSTLPSWTCWHWWITIEYIQVNQAHDNRFDSLI